MRMAVPTAPKVLQLPVLGASPERLLRQLTDLSTDVLCLVRVLNAQEFDDVPLLATETVRDDVPRDLIVVVP